MAATNGRLDGRITIAAGVTATVGGGTATISAGTYYTAGFLTEVGTQFAAASSTTCTASASLGESGTGIVTIVFGVAKAITWVSTDLRDLLGWASDSGSATTHTSPQHMRGTWLPECPYMAPNTVSNDWAGWREGDIRSVSNRAGYVWSLMGQDKIVNELSWARVPRAKTWVANETTVGSSWERFARDCIWGVPAWGTAGGPIRFYPDADNDAAYVTYMVADAAAIKPEAFFSEWSAGPWRVRLPRLVRVPGSEIAASRRFPADATEWATWFPSITAPTALWTCQDASTPLLDGIASFDLAEAGTTPTYQNAGDPLGRYSVGFAATSSRFQAALTTDLDVASESMTLLARFYVPTGSANAMPILRKKASAAGSNGYLMDVTGSTAYRGGATFDGGAASTAEINTPHDAQWIDMICVCDRTGVEVRTFSTLGTKTVALNASTLSLTTTTKFAIGDSNGITSEVGALVSYAAIWIGTALTSADYTTWVTPV